MLPEIIDHSKQPYFLQIRRDFIAICEHAPDPQCAGSILGLFEYWTRVKVASNTQARIQNALSEKSGEIPTQDETLWIFKSEEELQIELLHLFGVKKVRENREWLIESGYLLKRNNPRIGWDRTLQFQLDIDRAQAALDNLPHLASIAQNDRFHPADLPDQSGQNAAAIPENTTNTKKLPPPTIITKPQASGFTPPQFNSKALVGGGDETPVDEEGKPIDAPLTALELWILQKTGQQKISPGHRRALAHPVRWVDDDGKAHDGLPPNELFGNNPFQDFVQGRLLKWIQNKGFRINNAKIVESLTSPHVYAWFYREGGEEQPSRDGSRLQSVPPAIAPSDDWSMNDDDTNETYE